LVHFNALKELIGPAAWTGLKTRQRSKQYIDMYEALTYQPNLPKSIIGGAREFMFGYYHVANRPLHRRRANQKRTQDITVLQQILQDSLQSY
jgi:hypothetical protein